MLAQDKFAQANAVLGESQNKIRSPVGAARNGQPGDYFRTDDDSGTISFRHGVLWPKN